MPVRIALVGLGKIARDQHLPVLNAHPGYELVAIASRNASLPGVACFATLDELLASDVAFDAVAMCQPPQARFDAARKALQAGKHVFLEKPPGATLSEVHALQAYAAAAGTCLFASWHSRFAPGVAPARDWLAGRTVTRARIDWREDVRHWHPGQEWIWEAGGFGVFDPGVNALSIITEILPSALFLTAATLDFPSNRQAPVRADLTFRDALGAPVTAGFDFLQTGPQTWDIQVDTTDGALVLRKGGGELEINGNPVALPPEAEYRGLYDRFAAILARGAGEVDLAPLTLVADAFLLGERRLTDAFSY